MVDSVDELDLVPPKTAQENAQKVLDWRDEHGDEVNGMTRTGWVRANQLSKGEELSPEIVKKIAQFNRHRGNSDIADENEGEPWKDAGYVAWIGWGGDTGVDWAIRMSERIESIENTGMDTITTLSHKHKNDDNENEGMDDEETTVENRDLVAEIRENGLSELDVRPVSKNTYKGYFEGLSFEDDNWSDAVDRLAELHGMARSYLTHIVRHEASGHGRDGNVPVFDEPVDTESFEKFVENVEDDVDEETYKDLVRTAQKVDEGIRELFFEMIVHDDFMHDREGVDFEQLLSADESGDEEELSEYETMEECMDYHVDQEGYSRDQAYAMCSDKMDLNDEEVDVIVQPGTVEGLSEGDLVGFEVEDSYAYATVVAAEDFKEMSDGAGVTLSVEKDLIEEGFELSSFDVIEEDESSEDEDSIELSQGIMPEHDTLGDFDVQESENWFRPEYSEFQDNYDLEESFEELSVEDKELVASHFGRVDAKSLSDAAYSDLQLAHHSPKTGDVDRSAIVDARRRLDQSEMSQKDLERIDSHLANHLRNEFDDEDVSPVIERENSDDDSEEESFEGREFENGQLVSYETDYGRSFGRVKELTADDKYSVEVFSAKLGGGWSATGKEKMFDEEELSREGKFPQSLNDVFNENKGNNAEAETVEENSEDDMSAETVEEDSDTGEVSEQLSPSKVQQVGKKVRSVAEVLSDDQLENYLDRNDLDYSSEEFRDLVKNF